MLQETTCVEHDRGPKYPLGRAPDWLDGGSILLNFVSIEDVQLVLLVVSVQIIFETNPFLSDYSSIIFWIKNKRKLDKIPIYVCNENQEKKIQEYLKELQDSYFLSPA